MTWGLHGVVEGAAGIVENLAHIDTAGDQVVAGVDVATVRTGRSIEPGWVEVIPLPKMIDASEPGGVNYAPGSSRWRHRYPSEIPVSRRSAWPDRRQRQV